jgi:ATP-independent RNA helicase DbpA
MGRLAALEDQLGLTAQWTDLTAYPAKDAAPARAPMRTIMIDGGKKDKVRPGDIVGALTGELGLSFEQLGKINVLAMVSFVAVRNDVASSALKRLSEGKIKGRQFRCRIV